MLACLIILLTALSLAAEPLPEGGADQGTAEAPKPEVLTRTWAMRQVFTSEMRDPNPFSSTGWRSTHTHTWAVVVSRQEGTSVTYDERTCGIETEKVFGATTAYTSAFIDSVAKHRRTASLASNDVGARFKAGPYVQSFGVNLKDPYDDPLPTDPADPRLVDTDKDGHPGVTVLISHPMVGKGAVYVAQRSVARLEGTLHADGSIRGVVYTAPDMFKIDADRWWLRGDTPQRQHPDPKMSPFVMIPAADGLTCDQLLKQKGSIFPPAF